MESAKKLSHTQFTQQQKISFIIAITISAIFITACLPAIPQASHYHAFTDTRTFFGIPNFLNVASNLAFLLGGIYGLSLFAKRSAQSQEKYPWLVFLVGAILTAFGSAYYHFAPANSRLVWDRLPMTIVFMSFLSAMISERIHRKIGVRLLLPLLICGGASVFYWHFSELAGHGDLRWYGFVQFYPVLLIPVILLLFPARYSHSNYLGAILILYAVAKFCEAFDAQIFAVGHLVSGHTIKHLIAALPIFLMARMLRLRKTIAESSCNENSWI